ncbi:malonate decarboxylase subunit epsilon [Stutzerimonas zhaodongensis]|uniref:malonate decarboxylase subunit epsilon n=1 Tax=Stutzerimonas zhaodongensis TaxID=1176257 RepID=UPI00210266C3|nr:malonate decarboxylase subunit epsilon [Stutzerimonas zhaodongensis]MCQ2030369.1 malonate decarboxylase subunit epsilon [Stutzerimonas zhaodongensis]
MSSLFVFPGQGAQKPGMLHRLPQEVEVLECLRQASEALDEDALVLDSEAALRSTRAVQLCLLIAGVSSARLLMRSGQVPDYVAGLSIGAYAAAVVAGSLDFQDAVRLVALRGELMQNAYPDGFGMTALIGLDLGTVERLLSEVHDENTPVHLANINADNQIVIAGSDGAMALVGQRAKLLGASGVTRLAVSVPSHSALLSAPAARLAEAFAGIELRTPRLRYLSSTTARPIFDAERLRNDLAFNMCRVVDWYGTLRTAYERGVRLHIELPPGSVLTGLARRVFEQGTLVAFDGARLDTLVALLRQEADQAQ